MVAIVDDDMEKAVRCFKWSLNAHGVPRAQYPSPDHPTLKTSITLKSFILMERAVSPYVIKNLNGNPLDCRRENLKKMTLKEARALDRENLGPRESIKKIQKKWAKKMVQVDKPPKKKFELFPSSSSDDDGQA